MTNAVLDRILAPIADSATAWCGFDSEWYIATYPEAGPDRDSALRHYLSQGRHRGLSPNMYFDESWYRAKYSDIAAAIEAGELASGYEHYCTIGYPVRSPHWLYDDEVYAEYGPDLTDDVLVTFGCANRYDHFLKAGAREGRIAHLLFQPAIYMEAVTGSPSGPLSDASGAFQHYVRQVWMRGPEARTSPYFDPEFYLAHCEPARTAIGAGQALCALHHFLIAPPGERGEPLAAFSTAFYLERTPDAAAGVESGRFSSAYEHFLKRGVFALRQPSGSLDLVAYLARSATARDDYDAGRVRDLFAHALLHHDGGEAPEHEAAANASPASPSDAAAECPVEATPPAPARPADHPESGVAGGATFGVETLIEIDDTIRCPPDGLVLYGWMLAPPGIEIRLAMVCGGNRVPLDIAAFVPVPRTDVIAMHGARHGYEDPNCGFLAFVPHLLHAGERPMLEVTAPDGTIQLRPVPEPALQGFAALRALLDRFELRYGALARGFDTTVGPAMMSLTAALRRAPVGCEVLDFGTIEAAPVVTVIVPLYGRIDLAEAQLGLMTAHHPDIACELVYVLDDPRRRVEMLELAESMLARFGLPFRLLVLSRNIGYGPANNIALADARGRQVLLMNSDVFPQERQWLRRLSGSLDAHGDVGALGPLLLFEDGSVQHQGMDHERLPEFANWYFPSHMGKGRRPPAAGGIRRAPAITAACMLVDRTTLVELGGFDEDYAIGDFEDVDLCMRLRRRGLSCAVDMDVRMYHLERQSQERSDQRWRMNLSLGNAWLYQQRWGGELASGAP